MEKENSLKILAPLLLVKGKIAPPSPAKIADFDLKSAPSVKICRPKTSGSTVHFPEILQTERDI